MTTVSTADLIQTLNWRYATKRFDASKKIPSDLWAQLEDAFVLTPSSYGLQPWQFLVVESPEMRKELRAKSWGQSQVEESSHFVVITTLRTLDEAYIDRFMHRCAQVRQMPVENLAAFKRAIVGDAITGPRASVVPEWLARQAYIALGNMMTSAALVGIDTCPLEGLDPRAYDKILGLENSPYLTIVACAFGYRHTEDKYADTPKVRFEKFEMIKHL